jgi:protein transport protein SEC61 subunit alpha
MVFNLLQIVEPLSGLIPEVEKPKTKPTIPTKTAYTAITLFIYLICCQVPLYGVERIQTADPLYWTRVILASSRGTLMELGIGPIISASWLIQILTAIGLFKIKTQKDYQVLEGFEKTFALIICFG